LSSSSRDLPGSPDSPTRTILLVEDEALVRVATVDALRDLGFRVEAAASAAEALGELGALDGRIDAAIIDLGLPDRAGDALALELRAMLSRLPIVIASGYDDSCLTGLEDDALIKFLGKPYDSEQLNGILGRLGVRPRS
jgi:DNA-binding response OmpR family regulator